MSAGDVRRVHARGARAGTDHATAATGSPDTWHGHIHGIAFVVLVVASLAAPLATAVGLRGNPRWRRFPALSLAVVVLELAFSVAAGSLGDPAVAAWQAVVFGWFAALGAHLRRLQEENPLQ